MRIDAFQTLFRLYKATNTSLNLESAKAEDQIGINLKKKRKKKKMLSKRLCEDRCIPLHYCDWGAPPFGLGQL